MLTHLTISIPFLVLVLGVVGVVGVGVGGVSVGALPIRELVLFGMNSQ